MARILVIGRDRKESRGIAALLRKGGHATQAVSVGPGAVGSLYGHRPELLVLSVAQPVPLLRELARPVGSPIRRTPSLSIVRESAIIDPYEDEQQIIRTGRPVVDKEEKEVYPDGSITWLSTTKVPIFDPPRNRQ